MCSSYYDAVTGDGECQDPYITAAVAATLWQGRCRYAYRQNNKLGYDHTAIYNAFSNLQEDKLAFLEF